MINKRTLLLLAFSALLFGFPAFAENDFTSLVNRLTSSKLQERQDIIQEIVRQDSPQKKQVLAALLDGKLYYLKSDRQIVVVEDVDGGYQASSVFTQEILGTFTKRKLKKIGINNQIRQILEQELSLLDFNSPDPSLRVEAVKSTYETLDQSTLDDLKKLYTGEKNHSVKEAIEIAFALSDLQDPDAAVRIRALETLEGSIHPIVTSRINQVKASEQDALVQKVADRVLSTIELNTILFEILEKLFFGLSFGSVLILAAIGLAITFGVMGVINMAHGELIMLGAYTTYVIQLLLPNFNEFSLMLALPAAFMVSALAGILIQKSVIVFLQGRTLDTLLATFGISLILQQAVRTVFSPLNRTVYSPQWMSGSLQINEVLSLTWGRIYIILFCLGVFALLLWVMKKTSLGIKVRAVSQDRNMARAMGIPSGYVDMITFGLGSGVAGLAGVALSQLTNVGPNLGQSYIIDSFMVVVFGGVGNLWGTLLGGLSLGIANKFMEPWTGAVLAKIVILVFIILFIQKKPRGLFPQKGRMAEAE